LKVSHYVLIQVSDTGQGIPPENLGRIFEPFFTTKEIGVGTGLGLSTVNAIVKNHGGFLTVDSNLGLGTAFRVFLPALSSEAENMEVPERAADGFLSGNGELILVVDDEAGIRDLVRTVLETYGYRVVVAADGDEGLAVYTQNRDDIRLVLTDLDMPGKGGAHLIRTLEEINPAVRVISVSGLFEGNALGQVVGGPVRAVLQKPFSPAELLKTLHDTLSAA
jgi:CheY-like chemotaxis protein